MSTRPSCSRTSRSGSIGCHCKPVAPRQSVNRRMNGSGVRGESCGARALLKLSKTLSPLYPFPPVQSQTHQPTRANGGTEGGRTCTPKRSRDHHACPTLRQVLECVRPSFSVLKQKEPGKLMPGVKATFPTYTGRNVLLGSRRCWCRRGGIGGGGVSGLRGVCALVAAS